MAIFLLMDHDKTNADPEVDKQCYKFGDIVEVLDDSKPCVIPPQPPWLIIKVNGITKEQALKFMDVYWVDSGLVDEHNLPILKMERRRKYNFRLSSLPTAIANVIAANRYVEVTVQQVKNYLRNKETGTDGM